MNTSDLTDILKHSRNKQQGPKTLGVDIQKLKRIGKNSFQVSASVPRLTAETEVAASIANMFDGKVRVVPESMMVLEQHKSPTPVIRFVVAANRVSKPFNKADHRVVTAGVAVDNNDQIWRIEGEGENRRVVQEAADDLEEILRARQNRGSLITAAMNLNVVTVTNGDYAAVYDENAGCVRHGYVYTRTGGDKIMVDRRNLTVVEVAREAVLEAVSVRPEVAGLEAYETNASLSPDRIATIVQYLRKAYPNQGSFLDDYERLMRQYNS